MPVLSRVLGIFTVAVAMLAPFPAAAEPTMMYLVRHGEKVAGKDPELSFEGQVRAQNIAIMLHRAGLVSIFSSSTNRTLQTAQPLAQRSKVAVQTYDPAVPKALVESVKMQTGAVLVVGHSNTLTELVRLFGGAPGADIADNEYDRLSQSARCC